MSDEFDFVTLLEEAFNEHARVDEGDDIADEDDIIERVMSEVQSNLSAMKPVLISEIVSSVYSQMEKRYRTEISDLRNQMAELQERLLQLESMVDKNSKREL